jgi:hypothetical protein
MMAATANPAAPHVNFFAWAIVNCTKNPVDSLGPRQNVDVVRILPLATPMIEKVR